MASLSDDMITNILGLAECTDRVSASTADQPNTGSGLVEADGHSGCGEQYHNTILYVKPKTCSTKPGVPSRYTGERYR